VETTPLTSVALKTLISDKVNAHVKLILKFKRRTEKLFISKATSAPLLTLQPYHWYAAT